MTRLRLVLLPTLLLASCDERVAVNAPTDPAAPIETPAGALIPAPGAPGSSSVLPGSGPVSFVGRWAADASWCAASQGEQRPIEITATRFEGYENGCDLTEVHQVGEGYVASLRCVSQGATVNERVRLIVADQTLNLTYLDRDGQSAALTKCTTLSDTPEPGPPSL